MIVSLICPPPLNARARPVDADQERVEVLDAVDGAVGDARPLLALEPVGVAHEDHRRVGAAALPGHGIRGCHKPRVDEPRPSLGQALRREHRESAARERRLDERASPAV
jgi:hypothetical protein